MSEGRDAYWFEASALTEPVPPVADELRPAKAKLRDAWSKSRSLKDRLNAVRNADVRGLATDWLTQGQAGGLKRFAQDNGLRYTWQRYTTALDDDGLPGMLFHRGECRAILATEGEPRVEFGNYDDAGAAMPQEFGYIAVRHGLGAPDLILDSVANNAEPPTRLSRLYARDDNYLSLNATYQGSDSSTPLDSARGRVSRAGGELVRAELGGAIDERFVAFCEKSRVDAARALLTPAARRFLIEAGESFDVEITADWIFLYGYAFQVSTEEPDRWAWVFSVASRVLDQVQEWGGATAWAGRPSFYTDRDVPRPASLSSLPTPSPGWNAFWDTE